MQGNARHNILNAVAGSVALNLINPFVGIYAVKLGADNLQLGYLSSWPQAASVVAVLGAASAVARSRNKQRLIAAISLLGRAAALGAAAVPWFPETYRIWALIGFWVLAVFPFSAGSTALQSFLADVFTPAERGKAFAARNAWSTAAAMVVVLISGWLLDHLFPYPVGYQVIFFASFVAALAELYFFMRLEEREDDEGAPPPAQVSTVGLRTYLGAFRHEPFRNFLLCSIPFHFAWQLAWPIFTRFQVTDLQMDNTWLSLATVAQSGVMVLAYPYLARRAETAGNLKMLGMAALHLSLAPILTALMPSAPWIVGLNMFTAIGVAGGTLFVLNTLLDLSPTQGRPIYLAVHAALVSVSAAIAPLAGAYLMSALPIRTALGIATLLRVATGATFFILLHWNRRGKGKSGARAKESMLKPVRSSP